IRNFCKMAIDKWKEKPMYLLLLGKSVSAHSNRFNTSAWNQNLLPTFGYPSSDNLMTAGLGNAMEYEQALATGRISAKNSSGELLKQKSKVSNWNNPKLKFRTSPLLDSGWQFSKTSGV
ncbi:MAG: C25 family cysteine peptidase, partial [Actinomycetes bacterium]